MTLNLYYLRDTTLYSTLTLYLFSTLSQTPAHTGIVFDTDEPIVDLLVDILVERHAAVKL